MTQFSDATRKQIAELCKKYQIRELSLFGSRARGDINAESHFDFLVEFSRDTVVTFMTLGAIQTDLEHIVRTKVDLVPKEGLKPAIKEAVLSQAQVVYVWATAKISAPSIREQILEILEIQYPDYERILKGT